MATRLTPAKFLKLVERVYMEANPLYPIRRKQDFIHTDIFNSKKKYKMFRIYTFDRRNIRVFVEFINGFVRVYIEGADTGVGGWTVEMLESFSLAIKAAHEVLDASNQAGANQQ